MLRTSQSYKGIISRLFCKKLIDNRDEGLIFVDPMLIVATERQTRMRLRKNLPLASVPTLHKIRKMYPHPIFSNGEFAHQFDRINALISGLTLK